MSAVSKICTKCKENKSIDEFRRDPQGRYGRKAACNGCLRALDRASQKRRREDPEKRAHLNSLKRISSKARLNQSPSARTNASEAYKKHYRKNRSKILGKNRDYEKKRLAEDPIYRLRKNLRNRTAEFLRGRVSVTTMAMLGCSLSQLRDFLQARFAIGMTWENYGPAWHLDHVIPCSRFDLSRPEHVRACFHYSNLQPLFVEENLTKSDGSDDTDWPTLIAAQIERLSGEQKNV